MRQRRRKINYNHEIQLSQRIQDNLPNLFDLFIAKKRVTRADLQNVGFDNALIRALVINGIVSEPVPRVIALADFDEFYSYGKELEQRGELDKAQKCYRLCQINGDAYLKELMFKLYKLKETNSKLAESFLLGQGFFEDEIEALYQRGYISKNHHIVEFSMESNMYKEYKNSTSKVGKEEKVSPSKPPLPEWMTLTEQMIFDLYILKGSLSKKQVLDSQIYSGALNDEDFKDYMTMSESGYYVIKDFEKFRRYGEYLREQGDEENSQKCLKLYDCNRQKTLNDALDKIYNLITGYLTLTVKLLTVNGIEKMQIDALVQRNYLKRENKHIFSLVDVERFNTFIAELNAQGKQDEAALCEYYLDLQQTTTEGFQNELKIIYMMIFAGTSLTRDNFYQNGISEYTLEQMKSKEYIKSADQCGFYVLANYNELLKKAKEYERNNELEKAYRAYKSFLEATTIFQSLLMNNSYQYLELSLKMAVYHFLKRQYKEGYSYLQNLKNNNSTYELAYNLYTYLLSFIVWLPEESRRLVQNLLETELSSSVLDGVDANREFISNIFKQNFSLALKQFISTKGDNPQSQEDKLVLMFLKTIVQKQKEVKEKVQELISKEDIKSLREVLLRESACHRLSSKYLTYLIIVNDICMYEESGVIPTKKKSKTQSLQDLIVAKDYEEAYKKSIDLASKKGIPSDKNYPSMLLLTALRTFEKAREQQELSKEDAPRQTTTTRNSQYDVYYKRLTSLLNLGKSAEAEILVEGILAKAEKERYAYIVYAFIEISYELNDKTFMRVIGTLNKIIKGSSVSLDFLLKEFNDCIARDSLSAAKMYIDLTKAIIEHGDNDLPEQESALILQKMNMKYKEVKKQFNKPVDSNGNN